MNPTSHSRLTRIGVFYDGNFFFKVSNYYKYAHPRKARISISGLHEFIRHKVSTEEGVDVKFCQIVDAHFFRGRFSAKSAEERQQLYYDRVFDDILMGEGVVTHYLPMRNGEEKGVDVWLALEAFELASYQRFDVLVLITGDGDFVPLARKLNSLATRVMVLGWDFSYTDHENQQQQTTTSMHLLDEVPYPVMMQQIIDDKARRDDSVVKNLFVKPSVRDAEERPAAPVVVDLIAPATQPPTTATSPVEIASAVAAPNPATVPVTLPTLPSPVPLVTPTALSHHIYSGTVKTLGGGFGFIQSEAFPSNIFFHWTQLEDSEFEKMTQGQTLWFQEGRGPKGPLAVNVKTVCPPSMDARVED
jgi:cold shock CspA family protein/uncharacterized LabA/DUF88 family protein